VGSAAIVGFVLISRTPWPGRAQFLDTPAWAWFGGALGAFYVISTIVVGPRLGAATLLALVPLAEVSEYQSRLKALTGGQGAYTMELSHYDPVPSRKQQELAQAWRPREAQE